MVGIGAERQARPQPSVDLPPIGYNEWQAVC